MWRLLRRPNDQVIQRPASSSMSFEVTVQPAHEGGFVAWVGDLPGCVSEGETVDEALANISTALIGYLGVKYHGGQFRVSGLEQSTGETPERHAAHRRLLVSA